MKTFQSSFAMSRTVALAAVLATGGSLLSASASALTNATAANTTVRNTVYVNYTDAGNSPQPQITTTVDVTVSLVQAAATLAQVTPDASIAPGSSVTYTYNVTTNANGPDTQTITAFKNTDGTPTSTLGINGGTTALLLGASSVAVGGATGTSGTTTISVPSDQANDGSVNGIQGGDLVVINGAQFSVQSVTDNGAPGSVAQSQITVNNNAVSTAFAVGDLIQERKTFTILVTPGTYVGPGNKTITHTTSVSDGTNTTTLGSVTTTTINGVTLTVTKYVRCATGACTNSGPVAFTLNGTAYYLSGVSGAPGSKLEYLVRIDNANLSSTAKDVVIRDPIPAYTTLDATSLATGTSTSLSGSTGTATFAAALDTPTDGDTGEATSSDVFLFPGTGGTDVGAGADPHGIGGDVAGGATVYGRFQVSIQ